MKKLILMVATLIVGAQSALANATIDGRCAIWEDPIAEEEVANARTAWAVKCYPWIKHTATVDPATGKVKIVLMDTQNNKLMTGYPFFGRVAADGTKTPVVAPKDAAEPCWDTNEYVFVGYCLAGCFTPDQHIYFSNPMSYVEIGKASQKGLTDILLVDGVADTGTLAFKSRSLKSYTADIEDYNQQILVFRTADGELKVTKNHPLVDGRGYMVAASTLKVGDSLKTVYNQNSEILSIDTVDYYGKVYNINMGSSDIYDNIIVANDFLSGTVYFQNDGVSNLNREVLRSLIPLETIK